MSNAVTSLIGSSFADIVSAIGFAGSNVAGSALNEALSRVMHQRAARARNELLVEIQQGIRSPHDAGEVDEFVAILYRYMRAAQEGSARLNLRLMARVIKSQIGGEGLYASEFLRYAELIASLTREEVILIATRHRVRMAFDRSKQTADWSDTSRVNELVRKELVPTLFPTELDMFAALTALQRTGLVWPAAATTGGGFVWQDTPLLDRVVGMADFEGVVAAEAALRNSHSPT
jgi:hypothetical protein